MIKLYSISTCSWCKKVKRYLDEKGVSYEDIEIDNLPPSEEEAAIKEIQFLTGGIGVPVTVIKGNPIVGYSPDEFDEALKSES